MSAVQLNTKKLGHGKPIYIFHGLFGSLDNWQTIANELQKRFTVYLIDLRNHGKSPHTKEMTYKLMSEDIRQLMKDEDLDKINIIGHSMGGKVCYQLLNDIPHRIEKAMIIDIAPKRYKGGHEQVFKAMFSLDLDRLSKRSDAELIISQYIPEKSVQQFILKNLDRQSDHHFEWKCNLDTLYKEYDNICEEISFNKTCHVPIRIISGSISQYVTQADIDKMKTHFSNLSWHIVEGSGHWVHAEKPKEMLNEIISFL